MNSSDNSNNYIKKLKENVLKIFSTKKNEGILLKNKEISEEKDPNSRLGYVFSFIALSSKMAEIDSEINNLELKSIVKNFPLSANFNLGIEKLIIAASKDKISHEVYAEKIKKSFKNHRFLFVQTIDALIRIALSDGHMNRKEMSFLKKIVEIFKISEIEFDHLLRKNLQMNWSDDSDIFEIFEVKKTEEMSEITKRYHDLVKNCHPDHLANAVNLSPIYLDLIEEKFQILTEAYQNFKKNKKKIS